MAAVRGLAVGPLAVEVVLAEEAEVEVVLAAREAGRCAARPRRADCVATATRMG